MPLNHVGSRLVVEAGQLSLTLEEGNLISFCEGTLEHLLRPHAFAELVYRGDSSTPFEADSIDVLPIGENCCDYVMYGNAGLVRIRIETSEDEIRLSPSAFSGKKGLKAVRLALASRYTADRELLLPVFQGVRLTPEIPYLKKERLGWPNMWEAAVAFLHHPGGSCIAIRSEDEDDRCKALMVNRSHEEIRLGFDTENAGPLAAAQEAGGLTWILSRHTDGWECAADNYADWLEKQWKLKELRDSRAEWWSRIRFHLCWCPPDTAILDALAGKIDPDAVLIHLPDWRTDDYDRNYPHYVANDRSRRFLEYARHKGFHVMPHFNVFSVSANHSLFPLYQRYQMRFADNLELAGWYYLLEEKKILPFPSAVNLAQLAEKDILLASIHMGSSLWRNEITRRVTQTATRHLLEGVFLDQTNCLWNLDNALVEGMTNAQGVQRIFKELNRLRPGIIIGGEGLNEVTFRHQSFSQLHLFQSHHTTIDGLEDIAFPVSNRLYRGQCRLLMYANMNGANEESELRVRVHERMGGLPGAIVGSPAELLQPNRTVSRQLEMALTQ